MKKLHKETGFTLIELMIVVAIIAIIAAIAIPNLMTAKLNANEGAAIGAMRTITSAEAAFQAANTKDGATVNGIGEYGDLTELYNGGVSPTYIDSQLGGAGDKQGYHFVAVPNAETDYTANANPITAGTSGNRFFYADQSGKITQNPSAAASDTDPSV